MRTIYLDHAATTPMRPEVREAMLPFMGQRFGNPSSVHALGRHARGALEEARERVASAIGARRSEIVFTGSGTEADNLAVLGRWRRAIDVAKDGAETPAVACSAIEHKAVLNAARQAAREGARLILLGVDEDGAVLLPAVIEAIAERPVVLSVMWGNNEVGTLQPISLIGDACREAGVAFHSDAVQALGKVPVAVDPVDLLSVSAHKVGGPQGVGALYVRKGTSLDPILHGGGQENGARSGTHNVAGVVGFAMAVELAVREVAEESLRLRRLRDRIEAGLAERVHALRVNAGGAARLPHVLNVALEGVDAEMLLMALDLEGICVSTGSACQSGSGQPSHVLSAMGVADAEPGMRAFVRLSVGHGTTEEDVDALLECFPAVVERLRETEAIA